MTQPENKDQPIFIEIDKIEGREHDKELNEINKNTHKKDCGWAWIVVIGSLITHIITDGVTYSYGVLATEFIKDFDISRSTVGWMGSLLAAITLSMGPLASYLSEQFSYRKVAVVGSIISSMAFIAPYFYRKVWFLILTSSIICGIGFGMVYLPSMVIINIWFEKKRPLALGIAVCGSGVGTFIFSPIFESLLFYLGWELTMLVTGGISLLLIPFSLTFKDFGSSSKSKKEVLNDKSKRIKNKIEQETEFTCVNLVQLNIEDIKSTINDNDEINETSHLKDEIQKQTNIKCSYFEIMKNPLCWIFIVSNVFGFLGFNAPYMFAKDRALLAGLSAEKGSYLISFMGIGNCVGRIGFGYMASLKWVNRDHLFNITLMLCGLSLVISWFLKSYIEMILYTLTYGTMAGAFNTLLPVMLIDNFGLENVNTIYSICLIFQGVAVLLGPPFAGMIYDMTLSFNITFAVCGACIIVSGLIMYLIFIFRNDSCKKSETTLT